MKEENKVPDKTKDEILEQLYLLMIYKNLYQELHMPLH